MTRLGRLLDRLDDRFFFGQPVLGPEERVVWSCQLSRVQHGIARGGKLYVTERRVFFLPNSVERLLRVPPWGHLIDEVESLAAVSRGLNPFSGSLGGKFEIKTRDGDVAVFAVSRAGSVVGQLTTLLLPPDPDGVDRSTPPAQR